MRICCCQVDSVWEDKPATHARVLALLKARPVPPGSLVLLPEMFATGFSLNVDATAEGRSGPTARFLAQTARRFKIFILAGLVGRDRRGRGLNQAVLFNPRGVQAARYTKLHPFTAGGESGRYAAGDELVSFKLGPVQAAPFICYDLRFPEVFRHAARGGAQLFAVIASWPTARQSHWTALLRARAIENQAYVAGVNRCGQDPQHAYSGGSMIVDPRGRIVARAGRREMIVCADLDLGALMQYRREFPALGDLRRDFLPLGLAKTSRRRGPNHAPRKRGG